VKAVEPGGWDNRSFRLGERMIVRLPSAAEYAVQVEKEHRWLPTLQPYLPLEIPTPIAIGNPAEGYPWKRSIYRWIEGDVANPERISNLSDCAGELARFLIALHEIDPTDGPWPGLHSFHRGGSLEIYDGQTRRAIAVLERVIDAEAATTAREAALAERWERAPVWIHGDICAANLLVRHGRLSAVIDFGMLAVGDPACDLAVAWTRLGGESREVFRTALGFDDGTWDRARGWTLWKAAIIAARLTETNASDREQSLRVIDEVLSDWRRSL
jgi:aminoglycoside phosphotransferase (APT) family kinase protein